MLKKLSMLFCCAMILCCGALTGCKQKENNGLKTVRLAEVARSVFYAPMYVAVNNGYFKDEGIDIKLETTPGADMVMSAVSSKSADIGLMGPETTVYAQANGKKDYPIIFGQLTQKDGSFLVSKTDETDFKWANLKGKHVIAGRKGGMPCMTLMYVLKNEGIEISELKKFDDETSFAMQGPTFAAPNSEANYTTLFEPSASEMVKNGKGYIVAAIGEASGNVPFTAFSGNKSYIEGNQDIIKGFLRAIIKGKAYVDTNTAEDTAKAVQSFFSGIELSLLTSSIARYDSIDAWCDTPYFEEASYIKLQDILQNAGELTKRVEYTKAVDNTYVNAVLAEKN